jgi:MarR family transcriptional regulator, lower aerobic nicotinate degradation pathway regulator
LTLGFVKLGVPKGYTWRVVEDAPDDYRGGYDPPERVRRLPSWLSAEVARKARLLVDGSLAHDGAHRQHFTVLTSLAEQGPASQAELGRRLSIDPKDLHLLLAELEQGELIARARDERDRRRNVVTITRAGRSALVRLDKRIEAAQAALLAPLTTNECRELSRLLQKLLDPRSPRS